MATVTKVKVTNPKAIIELAKEREKGAPSGVHALGEFICVRKLKLSEKIEGSTLVRPETMRDSSTGNNLDYCMVTSIGKQVVAEIEIGDVVGVVTGQNPAALVQNEEYHFVSPELVYAKFTYADD